MANLVTSAISTVPQELTTALQGLLEVTNAITQQVSPSNDTGQQATITEKKASSSVSASSAVGIFRMINQTLDIIAKVLKMVNEFVAQKGTTTDGTSGTPSPTTTTPSGGPVSNEFMWKPVSDKDGNLAILLPAKLTGNVESVEVYDPKGELVETGKPSGVGNGGREHYRFSQPGGDFPDRSKVVIHMNDGTTQTATISHTDEKTTRKILTKGE